MAVPSTDNIASITGFASLFLTPDRATTVSISSFFRIIGPATTGWADVTTVGLKAGFGLGTVGVWGLVVVAGLVETILSAVGFAAGFARFADVFAGVFVGAFVGAFVIGIPACFVSDLETE